MFDRPPREPHALSWLWVALWSGLILATVPFVRIATDFVTQTLGRGTFAWIVGGIAVAAVVLAGRWLHRRGRLSLLRVAVLAVIAAWIAWRSVTLREEAIHYVQYGVLSLLLYRALAHRTHDSGIYLVATMIGTLIGLLDETVQWLAPKRVFGLQDVWLNLTAVALVQAAIAFGIRPALIRACPSAPSLGRACRLGALLAGLLALCHLNTPAAVAWYGRFLPGDVPDPGRNVMLDYGHLLGTPDGDTLFRSRRDEAGLAREVGARGAEIAALLDRYPGDDSYAAFLDTYTVASDPVAHEARVHLFRRDRFVRRAGEEEDPATRRNYWATAHLENRILEGWFGPVIRASAHAWPEGRADEVEALAGPERLHDSFVSRSLITAYGKWQAASVLAALALALFLVGRYLGRRA